MNKLTAALILFILISGCSDTSAGNNVGVVDRGVGPVENISISEQIDPNMAMKGFELFEKNCQDCHKIHKQKVGPKLSGVTQKREPEWVLNMILNPDQMIIKNGAAKSLLMEYFTPMTNQNLTLEEARAIYEYMRREDGALSTPKVRA